MFKPATKTGSKIRMAIFGAPGVGKTKLALSLGTKLNEKVALIDTEHGSASKYADEFKFDTVSLDSFEPGRYVKTITEAVEGEYPVLIIDSLSHAWAGKNGCLEQVDKIAEASKSTNSFAAWGKVTPMHTDLIEALLSYPGHLIVTMRTKTAYVMESYVDKLGQQKTKPVEVGLAPVQRESVEYEFDVVCRIEHDHTCSVVKSRCPALDGEVLTPDNDTALILHEKLTAWLSNAIDIPTVPIVKKEDWDRLKQVGKDNRWPEAYMKKWIESKQATGISHVEIYEQGLIRFGQPCEEEKENAKPLAV